MWEHAAARQGSRPDAYDMLRSDVARFGNFTVPLDQVGHLLTKPGDRDEHLKQFSIVMMRDLVTLSYELALHHATCKVSLQRSPALIAHLDAMSMWLLPIK